MALLFHKITIKLLVWYTFGFDLEEKLEKERNIRKTQANKKKIAKFVFLFLFLLGNGGSISGDHQCISSSVNFTDKLIRSFLQFRVTFDIIK